MWPEVGHNSRVSPCAAVSGVLATTPGAPGLDGEQRGCPEAAATPSGLVDHWAYVPLCPRVSPLATGLPTKHLLLGKHGDSAHAFTVHKMISLLKFLRHYM